jgi:hypothetical protein
MHSSEHLRVHKTAGRSKLLFNRKDDYSELQPLYAKVGKQSQGVRACCGGEAHLLVVYLELRRVNAMVQMTEHSFMKPISPVIDTLRWCWARLSSVLVNSVLLIRYICQAAIILLKGLISVFGTAFVLLGLSDDKEDDKRTISLPHEDAGLNVSDGAARRCPILVDGAKRNERLTP